MLQFKYSEHSRSSPSPPAQAQVLLELELRLPKGQGTPSQQVFLGDTVMLSNVRTQNSKPETGYCPRDAAAPASWALRRRRELWWAGDGVPTPLHPPPPRGSRSPVTGSEGSRLADTRSSGDRGRLRGARPWPLSKDRAGMGRQGAERK